VLLQCHAIAYLGVVEHTPGRVETLARLALE
jgi:hypothetical protein